MQWTRGDSTVSTDPGRLDVPRLHALLATTYWATGIPSSVVARAVRGSMVFGVYQGTTQIGGARVISDRATFAYLADVIIDPAHRGHGVGSWLVACVLAHPELQGLRRWMLATRDAHDWYRRFGFTELSDSASFMERVAPDVHRRAGARPA